MVFKHEISIENFKFLLKKMKNQYLLEKINFD